MTCHLSAVTISLCVAATTLFAGCQQPMGAATASYAPAGTLPPASSPPLVPFGSLNGATRVPPPPTGSSQVSSGYDGQPAAQFSAQATPGGFGNPLSSVAANGSSSGQRQSLGGMPVIDLTAGLNQSAPPIAGFATAPSVASAPALAGAPALASAAPLTNTQPVGSGVVTADWQNSVPNISVEPVDLAARLRPLDASQATTILPLHPSQDYVPADSTTVAMTQYRTEAHSSPAWQAVQPASAELAATNTSDTGNAFEQRGSTQAYASQSPARSLPSTDPVESKPSVAAQTGNLLWRNPSVAR